MITASRWQGTVRGLAAGSAVVLVAAVAGGCKSGSSWNAKPSWWTFGGSPADAAALASAPAAPTDVTKPSASSKPYPTTTTPEGYVLESAKQAGGQVADATAAVPDRPAAETAAVTYGSTPPPTSAAARPAPAVDTAGGAPTGLSSISPQVGPYGTAPQSALQPDQPLPTPSSPAYAGAPAAASAAAFAAPAAASESRFDGGATRVADARAADGWAAPPPAAPPAAGESRYAGGGSRFSGIDAAPPAAGASAAPVPGAAAFPTEPTPPAVPTAPPAAAFPPAAAAVMPAPATLPPAAAPPPAAPPTPTRRPDPGYRPGGTSSYRPSRTILAGDAGSGSEGVRQASFQMDAPPGP